MTITVRRTDPLYTVDLSNPAHPRQAGDVVMPGWVYQLETRGNRVIGLGFDQNSGNGAIIVSLFDVSNLNAPTMLDRVNFGATWAHLPRSRIAFTKGLRILEDRGLFLMPFSSWGLETNSVADATRA